MPGVRAFRDRSARSGRQGPLDLRILSAGYGLVPGDRKFAPYECTFQGMKTAGASGTGRINSGSLRPIRGLRPDARTTWP